MIQYLCSLHPSNPTDSKDISSDKDENVRPPFHKLRRHGTSGSLPLPIASSFHLSPQQGLPPKLEPVREQGYYTASGGSTPEPKSPSLDPLNITNCWYMPSKRCLRQ